MTWKARTSAAAAPTSDEAAYLGARSFTCCHCARLTPPHESRAGHPTAG